MTVAVPVADRIWRRFTPAQRLTRFVVYFAIVAAIVVSLQTIEVIPEFLADAPEQELHSMSPRVETILAA